MQGGGGNGGHRAREIAQCTECRLCRQETQVGSLKQHDSVSTAGSNLVLGGAPEHRLVCQKPKKEGKKERNEGGGRLVARDEASSSTQWLQELW